MSRYKVSAQELVAIIKDVPGLSQEARDELRRRIALDADLHSAAKPAKPSPPSVARPHVQIGVVLIDSIKVPVFADPHVLAEIVHREFTKAE